MGTQVRAQATVDDGPTLENAARCRLSPLKFAHINFHGRYSFALPNEVQGGQLRSTAKPETVSTTI